MLRANWPSRILFCLLLYGCAEPPGADPQRRSGDDNLVGGEGALGRGVLARVGNTLITIETVNELAERLTVDRERAYESLLEEALLSAAAEAEGLSTDPMVRRAWRQMAVQTLLEREIERTPSALSAEDVQARRRARPDRFRRPERRASVYLFARGGPQEDAGRAYVADWVERLRGSAQPARELLSFGRAIPTDLPFEVVVDEEPALAADGRADPAYLTALYALEHAGEVTGPVRTHHGWYALVLTEIQPRWVATDQEAYELVRLEVSVRDRRSRLRDFVTELAGRDPVQVEQSSVQVALRLGEAQR